MSQKPKVAINREDDFQEVDALLTEALASLEETNARVLSLLESEPTPPPRMTDEGEEAAARGE